MERLFCQHEIIISHEVTCHKGILTKVNDKFPELNFDFERDAEGRWIKYKVRETTAPAPVNAKAPQQ